MAISNNTFITAEEWENQLDALGPFAGFEALVQHLECAPESAPTKTFLADYVSALSQTKGKKHGGSDRIN